MMGRPRDLLEHSNKQHVFLMLMSGANRGNQVVSVPRINQSLAIGRSDCYGSLLHSYRVFHRTVVLKYTESRVTACTT